MGRVVVGVSGASGFVLAQKAIVAIVQAGEGVELVFSKHALVAANYELKQKITRGAQFVETLPKEVQNEVRLYKAADVGAFIASGSYQTSAMVVIPCSMATLAAIATGLSDNLLRRAADVTLKEKRPLVLVPRETPLSTIHLKNMLSLSEMGATIVPPIPAWYTLPKTVADIEDFIVGKVLDVLRLKHSLYPRWGGEEPLPHE